MDVSIILVNYNTKQLTSNCIQSIAEKTTGVEYEIILVDNASTDGSKEAFESDERVRYIYSEKNGGFGYANNIGMRIAKGKYFFLLNSDTLLVNNAVKEFFDYAENKAPETVLGCYLVGDDGTYRNSFFYFPAFTIWQFIKRNIYGQDMTPNYTDREVECVSGADMFIPRSAIELAGMFDDNIFLYGEEGELQYRMMQKGVKRMLINTPKIIHLEGQSSGGSARYIYGMKSHFYILKKHMNICTYWLARMFYKLHP